MRRHISRQVHGSAAMWCFCKIRAPQDRSPPICGFQLIPAEITRRVGTAQQARVNTSTSFSEPIRNPDTGRGAGCKSHGRVLSSHPPKSEPLALRNAVPRLIGCRLDDSLPNPKGCSTANRRNPPVSLTLQIRCVPSALVELNRTLETAPWCRRPRHCLAICNPRDPD